jgi:hypothetical protein
MSNKEGKANSQHPTRNVEQGRKSKKTQLFFVGYWLFTCSFIAVQMAWVLRPFIGSPSMTPQFFRQEAWSNAYIALARIIVNLFAGN